LKLILICGVAVALGLLATTGGTPSVRERELDTGRLVLRASAEADPFMLRRAATAVRDLEDSAARRALARAASALAEGDRSELISGLLVYGTVLERHGEYAEAVEIYRAVLCAEPSDVLAALHTARAARKAGRRKEAVELYRQAGAATPHGHPIGLMARIGESLVSERPLEELTAALRAARSARDTEAMAVAREERARLHLAAGKPGAALRDLGAAAARFPARVDRVRVLHQMAEILVLEGDALAAREALLCALDHAGDPHRGHTLQRLRTLARSMGDELELRRHRGRISRDLVILVPARMRARTTRSRVRQVSRLRDLLPPCRC
jgi:tetratricopeptide (TPR) repeat protein